MKKVIITILIILVLYIGFVIYNNNHYKEVIEYKDEKFSYELKINKPFITVNKYIVNEWKCITAPCPESTKHLVMIYTIPITKHYKKIIDNNQEGINYEIIEKDNHSGVKTQGYVYDDSNYELSIYLGQRNSSGYEIIVKKIEIDSKNDAFIELEEKRPSSLEVTTQEFTQPMITIRFKKLINNITITDNYDVEYKEIAEK